MRAFPKHTEFAGDSGKRVGTYIYKDGVRACGFGTAWVNLSVHQERTLVEAEWVESNYHTVPNQRLAVHLDTVASDQDISRRMTADDGPGGTNTERYMEQSELKHVISLVALFVLGAFAFVVVCSATQQPSSQHNSNQTASLHGVVTTTQDGSELGVAGVLLKLSRVPAIGTSLTANTDENGKYEFQKLEPGSYSILITAPGFKVFTKSIELDPQEQKVQDFKLQLQVVTEKVEVNETAAGISTESSAPPPVIVTNTELITLPTPQEKVKDIIAIAPGVIKTLDSKLAFKGADENQSLLLVNSARTTDPVTGSFSAPIPTDAVESFAVYKTPYDASLGSFSGGLTAIETKSPENKWTFKVRGVIPQVRGKEGHIVGLSEAIPGVAFDAPIIPHKLLFSEVFQYDMKKYTIEGLPWPHDVSKKQGFNSFSTLQAVLSPNHVLTLTVNAFPLRWQQYDISALDPRGWSGLAQRHSSCLWLQVFGVEAHPLLPHDQYDCSNLPRQGQTCHFWSHAFSNEIRITRVMTRARSLLMVR